MLPPTDQEKGQGNRRPAVEIIGLCDQQFHIRQRRPEGEPHEASCARKKRPRESQLWEQAISRIGLKPQAAPVRWVRVCDRGADIYEHLQACQHAGHGFVIRASQDRALVAGAGSLGGRLFATAQGAPGLGEFRLEWRGRGPQEARMARLKVSTCRVGLRAPQRPGRSAGSHPPLVCSVIRVWEEKEAPPPGAEPLEWVLLCDAPVEEFASAHECVLQYATRWLIEEFHKALKSGLGVERLQRSSPECPAACGGDEWAGGGNRLDVCFLLGSSGSGRWLNATEHFLSWSLMPHRLRWGSLLKTASRLFAAIALLSVVALRLLELREHLRQNPQRPAPQCGLETLELEVLRLQSKRPLETVQDVALALGRLGGHLNRKGDGQPGWQALWRAMHHLQTLAEGVQLASRLNTGFG